MLFGIYPGSFKPLTLGHYKIIELASSLCEQVILFISISDRIRINEYPIYGSDMKKIWDNFIIPTLPSNIIPIFNNTSVINKTYEFLGKYERGNIKLSKFILFGGENDIKNNFKNLQKYYPFLSQHNLIEIYPIPRDDNYSGTNIRKYIKTNNFNAFAKDIYPPEYAYDIWNILSSHRNS